MPEFIINKITETKKGRYALFCEDEFLFSIDEETLLRHHINKGVELSGEELMLVREASDYQRAKNKALAFLALREHSEKELYDKLCRTFDTHSAASAITRLREVGLVNDESFATRYAEELMTRRGCSKREAQRKLVEKGISRELCERILGEYDDDETLPISELIEKKYLTKLQKENGRDSVIAALMRKGFSLHDIKAALERYGSCETEEY